ncbi:HlyD family efflux transporter periplasmic adaptor subunit [bacterium]|nr:HlyD family efflux transporter periplasmic adaptor subunit [bacterium]MBU1994081.1 HlyD family efflux transporter periplasmic adaptor subunit [bacterium]
MKILLALFFMYTLSFSKVYYAKVEPYELRNIASNVSGLVLFTDENSIGKILTSDSYIRIDSELDNKELEFAKDKLEYLSNILISNESILNNLKASLSKKKENYKKIESLQIKSVVEKDKEFHDLIASENQFLNTQKEIQNLKVQIVDLKLRIAQLQRSISDKNLNAKDFVLYEISVKVGQVVGVATPLAKVADTSSAILTVYLDEEDVKNAKQKVIYLDEEKTSYKVSRLLNIADSKNISKYMAQIIIKSPKLFSKLVKVELRDE